MVAIAADTSRMAGWMKGIGARPPVVEAAGDAAGAGVVALLAQRGLDYAVAAAIPGRWVAAAGAVALVDRATGTPVVAGTAGGLEVAGGGATNAVHQVAAFGLLGWIVNATVAHAPD